MEDRTSRLQASDHDKTILVAVEPGEKSDPSLVVVRRRREDMAGQGNRRCHLSAISLDVICVQCAQGGGGSRSDSSERAEQRVGMMDAVTLDQLRIVEVITGVEPHACWQRGPQLLL